jgi:hypothetical protein
MKLRKMIEEIISGIKPEVRLLGYFRERVIFYSMHSSALQESPSYMNTCILQLRIYSVVHVFFNTWKL